MSSKRLMSEGNAWRELRPFRTVFNEKKRCSSVSFSVLRVVTTVSFMICRHEAMPGDSCVRSGLVGLRKRR